jgi:hypothetical protein
MMDVSMVAIAWPVSTIANSARGRPGAIVRVGIVVCVLIAEPFV